MERRFRNIVAGHRLPYGSLSDSDDNASGSEPVDPTTIWVFGYGSLCWNPGFEYSKCVTGYIRGFVRRFWQGNTTHRGTKEKVCSFIFILVKLVFYLYKS